jgi:hypothetical protein
VFQANEKDRYIVEIVQWRCIVSLNIDIIQP